MIVGTSTVLAWDNFKRVQIFKYRIFDSIQDWACERRCLADDMLAKKVEVGLAPFSVNVNHARSVIDPPKNIMFFGEPVDKRSKANPLHTPGNDDGVG